jgi:Fe-S-cluster containining protein
VRVTGDDYERLGDDAEALVLFLENEAFMRIVGDEGTRRCAALDVRDGRFSCRVYERRPQVCRDLARGSPACEGEVATKRERASAAIIFRP